jgi:GDPmannose 4,6-dehydratase
MAAKKALITGITGQDGSYMAELLLEKGYGVYGLVRRSSSQNLDRIPVELHDKINFVQGDLTDQTSLDEAIRTVKPDEVYNLAAQSFVPVSWNQPVLTSDVTGLGVTRMLEAIHKIKPDTRFYQASSSEMFGKVQETPQTEKTSFYPRSPYAVAKIYGHWATVNYRESYKIAACSGICFNHESPRRGLEFVTRKVTHTVAKIKLGLAKELRMGNTSSKRDWGYAKDYVEAMWLMLQQNEKPENFQDFVISTGVNHSVQELIDLAFDCVNLKAKDYVVTDPQFLRPAEVDYLIGDASKAHKLLGWKPQVSFEKMIDMMVAEDLKLLKNSLASR